MQVRELAELKTNCRRTQRTPIVRARLCAFLAWKRISESLSDLKLGCYKVVLLFRKFWIEHLAAKF